ncbi:MAG: glycerol-3-phosphate acyltransferase [Lachnospiraceae bacterium]|nr:glycerol-3-phosphate acyltransferase [Lachnospiraceae bacterium]
MGYAISILGGYLIGTINPSYIIARIKGFDIRKSGSGNAGGSNAVITMGGKIGILCSLLDILKAYMVVVLTVRFFPECTYVRSASSVAVILGHMFPFYMGFKGGKGLACLGGTILAYDPMLFVIMLTMAVVIAFVTDYIVFVPLTVSVIYPIIYCYMDHKVIGTKQAVISMLILFIATLFMWNRHFENLKRIKNGTEAHLSYLWKKDKELERIKGAVDAKGASDDLSDPEKLNLK